jgi:hypothetical protein
VEPAEPVLAVRPKSPLRLVHERTVEAHEAESIRKFLGVEVGRSGRIEPDLADNLTD